MRIGIFGGAFNPPHNEHINIVNNLLNERKYDKILIIPSNNPPHKKSVVTSFNDRLNMLNIVFEGIDKVEICDIEGRDNIVHYSYDLISKLKSVYSKDGLEFIIGGDSMIDFHKWYRPDDIIKMIRLIVVARGTDDGEKLERAIRSYREKGADIVLSSYIANECSSSLIRCRLFLKDDNVFMNDKLYSYIISNGLYSDYDDIINKLRDTLNEHRFEHTKGVARMAIKINEKIRLDFNKVMLAALLHDCAKSVKQYTYDIPEDTVNSNVEHAFMGRQVAMNEYGVKDSDVLNAIEFHCTAKPGMTELDKLIYCADMVEEGRQYDGVEELRELVLNDLDSGFIACLNSTYNHILEEGFDMYYLTKEAYLYYNGTTGEWKYGY